MVDLVLSRPGLMTAGETHWSNSPHLGLGYLSAVSRERGLSVRIVDGRLERHTSEEETANEIYHYQPAFVGLSAFTIELNRADKIAQLLKEKDPGIVTVLGGPHANSLPKESFSDCSGFDYLIAGEAENSMAELIIAHRNGESKDSIVGLYRKDNTDFLKHDNHASFEEDLSALPFPAWDLFPRTTIYPIMSERGCPYNCVFCSHNLTKRIRSRSVEHVMEEIRWLYRDFDAKHIYFEDETFGLNHDRTVELLNLLIDFNQMAGIRFKAQTRVDHVSEKMIKLMRRAGFEYLELGVESGDPTVLSNSGKNISLEQVKKSVFIAKQNGIKVWLKFIIGLPGETKHSVRKTIDFAVSLNPHRLSVAVIVPYPGSRIYEWAQKGQNGYHFLSKDWNKFDKYFGASVELDTLSYPSMRRFQIQMYFETYLLNGRFLDLLNMAWVHRSLAFSVARSLFKTPWY